MSRLMTVLAVFLAVAWHSQHMTATDGSPPIAVEDVTATWRQEPTAPCYEDYFIRAHNLRTRLPDGRVFNVMIPEFYFQVPCRRRRPIDYGGEY